MLGISLLQLCTQDVPAPIEVQTHQAQCQYEQVGGTDGAAANQEITHMSSGKGLMTFHVSVS